MNSVEMMVFKDGKNIKEAVQATDKLGQDAGLSNKEVLRLQLLAEELLGMMQSIAGEVEAKYRVEQEDKHFNLILDSALDMTKEMRKTLLSVSTTGENTAAKGFMGKLRDMIYSAMLPSETGPSSMSMGLMSMGSPSAYSTGENLKWSMTQYMAEMRKTDAEEAKGAWDELEKSITASIADDISIRIKGSNVRITITKTFA